MTITTIIKNYELNGKLSVYEKSELRKHKIANWIWWEWYNLDNILFSIVELPYFDTKKSKKLIRKIDNNLSVPHDLEFYIWWTYIDFTVSNLKFALWLFKILHWTTIWKRLWITLAVFWILQKFGKKHFNFI